MTTVLYSEYDDELVEIGRLTGTTFEGTGDPERVEHLRPLIEQTISIAGDEAEQFARRRFMGPKTLALKLPDESSDMTSSEKALSTQLNSPLESTETISEKNPYGPVHHEDFPDARSHALYSEFLNRLFLRDKGVDVMVESDGEPAELSGKAYSAGVLEKRRFNPLLHPRDPRTEMVVERPYPVPSNLFDMFTRSGIQELARSLPDFADRVADLRIDLDGDDELSAVISEAIDSSDDGGGGGSGANRS